MPEIELIQQIKAGDNKAFTKLVELFSDRVINTSYKFLLDKQDAEDIAQEVFVEIFHSIHHFRGEATLSTWIYRIAISKCLDELKKRKRKKRITSFGKIFPIDIVSGWMKSDLTADRELHLKETLKELMKAMDQLPENQRVAYTLSKVEGYTNPEIAEIMQTSTPAIEVLISRAKSKLIQVLQKNKSK